MQQNRKTYAELEQIYRQPLFDLLHEARSVHKAHWQRAEVQLCTLLNVKVGGCSEDCSYCSQSAHYSTGVQAEKLMDVEEVMIAAKKAHEGGSTRFCMGAAWKGVRTGDKKFEQMLGIIREVNKLGMEVCVTLGNLGPTEANELKAAGVTAYNHNIDTSPEHYSHIVTTHTFQDRLNTIAAVQQAGMSVCCGGILGLGETVEDRLRMLEVLCGFVPAPESVPINCLVPVPGTPLGKLKLQPVDTFEVIRLIATARIALPGSKLRLSAGRTEFSREAQTLCFYAGANSIFYGNKLLTTSNPEKNEDLQLLKLLDLAPQPPCQTVTPLSI